jgi:hypothetical protein
MAILLTLMALVLMSLLSGALIVTTSTESAIAANFRSAQEGLYAADAALERAIDDLAAASDWNAILEGSTRSEFVDGPPGGIRTLPGGGRLDLDQRLSLINCRRVVPCSASDLTAITSQRPWGPNNPVWRLFAFGPLSSMLPAGAIESAHYVTVMVADDPAENDGNPLRDGIGPLNPGSGVLSLRADALGPRGARQTIEATVARAAPEAVNIRVLSWRLIR